MSAGFWSGRRVTVTGGAGFLGRHVVAALRKRGCEAQIPRRAEYDFTDLSQALAWFRDHPSDLVIHGAAYYGGIWINQLQPGRIYYENLVLGANLMEAARRSDVKKVVNVGTACSYPGHLEGELREDDLWNGPCHESVKCYGLTKRMLTVQADAYRKQYGLNSIHLILTNLYGPHDCYHPDRSHVVAALIRKWVEACLERAPSVEVWGTGKPIREFLYVEDCAEAIVRAAESYDRPEPLNVGTGVGSSIRELAENIHELTGFSGALTWRADKPDGQMKKVLDVSRMQRELGWEPPTALREGLARTIAWYRENKQAADARP